MNKKIVLWAAAALVSNASVAAEPQRILPGTPNQNPVELSYRYQVLAPAALARQAYGLEHQIEKKKRQGIEPVRSLDSLPDVVFVLDDNTPEAALLTAAAERTNAYVVSLAPQSKANLSRATELLEERYFSGQRPTYSTVFSAGKEYHNYRIPSVVATRGGTIVALAEARAFLKDQAENDIVARRSTDGGATWGELIVVAENGQSSLNNPMAIYVERTDRIVLLYQDYPPKTNEGNAASGSVRCFVVVSDDQGATWSAPRDITASVLQKGATSFCTGPGVGIVLAKGAHAGRIVVPCNVNAPVWYNYLIYSDDQGQTWQIAPGRSAYGLNESQVVELGEDSLLVVSRSHRNIGDTAYVAPKGWSPWNFERVTRRRAQVEVIHGVWADVQVRPELIDPTCQGSVVAVDSLLLLVNPASDHTVLDQRPYRSTPPMRINGSVRYSRDGGKTWSPAKRIYGNRRTEFQYSVLTPLGGGKIGCLFEANADLKFTVFDLDWLTH